MENKSVEEIERLRVKAANIRVVRKLYYQAISML